MSTTFAYPNGPLLWHADPKDFTGDNVLGLYTTEATKRYTLGTRHLTWNGKVYVYSLSGASCYTGRGNVFNNTISSNEDGIDYAVLAADSPAGCRTVSMTNAYASAMAEDALAGGQIVIKPTETYTDGELMFRTVVGNTAAAATSGVTVITLDAPLETAVTTDNYAFVMPSPYSDIRYVSTNGKRSFAGVAATYVSAASKYFWLQTYGLCWICPGGTEPTGKTQWYRSAYWRHDGTIDIHSNIATYVTDQLAGFVVDNNVDDNGSTVICLQVSI